MAHIGVRELRAALSTYLRRAQQGERVVVTVDGAPVAELSPLRGSLDGISLADLVARGAVVAPRRRGEWVPGDPLLLNSGARIDRAVREVRS
jgi:prevent-host-death family protein